MRVFFALLLLGLPARALAARCELTGTPWIEGRIASGARARAVDAQLGQTIRAFVAVPGRLDGRKVVFGESGSDRASWGGADCPAVQIAWSNVEPRMQHEKTPSPNKTVSVFANAVVFGPNHGRWIGYDHIEYYESPRPDLQGWAVDVKDATPTEPHARQRPAELLPFGVMRLKVTIRHDGVTLASPGADDAPQGQIADRVFRFTIRRDDSFLGWLTSFFNVPYLFGSAGSGSRNQAERYVGADCADILVAALRRSGRRNLDYSNVSALVSKLQKVGTPAQIYPCPTAAPCEQPAPRLRFGTDVRPGDLLAMNYQGASELPRAWDHIVAVVEDRGIDGAPADGLLGPEDLVAETGSAEGLKFDLLGDQGAIRVVVLRP
jgi:hypothetical protein